MKLTEKNETIFKIIVGILAFLIGLTTIILSILNLAKVTSSDSTLALRIVIGVMLCILGLANSIVLFINSDKKLKIATLATNAVVMGFGIFLFTKQAASVIVAIVGVAFPIIIASFGGILLIKSVIELARKTGKVYIFYLIISIILLVAGILFVVYNKELNNVIWLIVGLTIMACSVIFIVFSAKKNKSKNAEQVITASTSEDNK